MEIRNVVKIDKEDIVVEFFKNEDGAIIRQQSFTKGQLEAQKNQMQGGLARINGMLALLNTDPQPVVGEV